MASAKKQNKAETGEKSKAPGEKRAGGSDDAVAKVSTSDRAEGKLHSPIVPLLWLLIPFVGVIVYGYLSGE